MNIKYCTPESVPAETRAGLRILYADPDYPKWSWEEFEEGSWHWELFLFEAATDPDENDAEWGSVYISACEQGQPLEHGRVPELGHKGWLISNICDDIYVPGTLQEVKVTLDSLLYRPVPEFPFYALMSIQPEVPVLTIEEFKGLQPGDLIKETHGWGSFLVEHAITDYPGPFSCRIYCRRQGGKDHNRLVAFTLADHRERNFVRRVRQPLWELHTLINSIEKGATNYEVARAVGISRTQVNCLVDIVKNRPDIAGALLGGVLSLDEVVAIGRDSEDQPLFDHGELTYTYRLGPSDQALAAARELRFRLGHDA